MIFEINKQYEDYRIFLQILKFTIYIVIFLPDLGLEVRRLHDTGKSGWLLLYKLASPLSFGLLFIESNNYIEGILFFSYLTIILGELFLLCLYCKDSEQMPNKYGPSPKYVILPGDLIPNNNYIPPDEPNPQSDSLIIDVTPNQSDNTNEDIPYTKPKSVSYQETSNKPKNNNTVEAKNNSKKNNISSSPQKMPTNSQEKSNQHSQEDSSYPETNPITNQNKNPILPEDMNNGQENNFPPANPIE